MELVITLKLRHPTHPPSIERHLRRSTLAAVCGVLLIAFLILDYVVVHWIASEFDRAQLAKARALVTLTKQYGDRVELDFADEFMPEFEAPVNPEYFQIWREDGDTLERSRSLRPNDLPRPALTTPRHAFFDLSLPDGRAGRAIEIVFLAQIEDKENREAHNLPRQQQLAIVVARERESLNRSLWLVQFSLLAAVLVMIVLIAWGVKHSVKIGLKPLHEIGLRMRKLDADQLHDRLDIDTQPRELQPLIEQFNSLLQRLELSFQREQRFSADVAHELRTPVAELQTLAEVATRWPEDRQALTVFFQDALGASKQMQCIINNLLALARCEKGNLNLDHQQVELSELINSAWLRVQKEAQKKSISFVRQGVPALQVYTGINEMELILNNLFSNAVAYSRLHSEIVASIAVHSGTAKFSLSNDVENLVYEDLSKMFGRLWRKDPFRNGEHHVGLGLPLVKAYAQALNLEVVANLDHKGCFCLSISGLHSLPEAQASKENMR